eukprot:comp12008_c0_seq1/m.6698 comp12008_c0_seq1/g.6698  ORF comp12008_c0_seq1/g.6698 comp12008_c0_seq1/m.6698 type:complete len:245 (-) comp12008_c0_seq1:551-1285(-)
MSNLAQIRGKVPSIFQRAFTTLKEQAGMAGAQRTLKVTVTSDNICPWCFVGRESLEKAAKEEGVNLDVTWLPFFLNKGFPKPGESVGLQEYIDQKYGPGTFQRMGGRLQQAADAYALGIKFTNERKVVNTSSSHRLSELAVSTGKQHDLIGALFRSYFEKGEDIGSAEVLERIAREVGLPDDVINRWKAGEGEKEVDSKAWAGQARGITGVPFFVLENQKGKRLTLSGGQPPDAFKDAFEELLS